MSNSASVSFSDSNGEWESITLFEHWGGSELHSRAKAFAKEIAALPDDGTPLGRLEPSIVMVEFVRREIAREFRPDELVKSSFWLERSRNDGDNTNHGHVMVRLKR